MIANDVISKTEEDTRDMMYVYRQSLARRVVEAYELSSVPTTYEKVFSFCERRKGVCVTNRIRIPPAIRRWSVNFIVAWPFPVSNGLGDFNPPQEMVRRYSTHGCQSRRGKSIGFGLKSRRRQPCGRDGTQDAIEAQTLLANLSCKTIDR